jgi:hypothetical protein
MQYPVYNQDYWFLSFLANSLLDRSDLPNAILLTPLRGDFFGLTF